MGKYTNRTALEYHQRQLNNPYESTKQLVKFVGKYLEKGDIKNVIDIPCGSGINIIELSKLYQGIDYLGVDISKEAIDLGRKYINVNGIKNIQLFEENLYSLDNLINYKFDASLIIQTLFCMEDPFDALKIVIKQTKKFLFINSLFTYDSLFIKTKVIKLDNENEHFFNIIPIKKLQKFLEPFGGEIIEIEELIMPIDIEKKGNGLGSHTKKLFNNERLVFTSDIYLPWKLIAIKFS